MLLDLCQNPMSDKVTQRDCTDIVGKDIIISTICCTLLRTEGRVRACGRTMDNILYGRMVRLHLSSYPELDKAWRYICLSGGAARPFCDSL